VVAATARIARAVAAPVTADIENGYGDTPEAVGRSIGEIIAAGAVGVNLEDGLREGPRRSAASRRRFAHRAACEAARAAGVPIVINARTDLYIKNIGDEESRFAEAVARGRAYLAAGADCFYPIGLRDPATMGRPRQGARRPHQHQRPRRVAQCRRTRGARSSAPAPRRRSR